MKVRILIVIAFLIGYFYPFQVLGNELKKQDIPGSNYIEDEVSITEWIITPTSLVTNEIQPRQRIEMNIQSTQAIKSFVLQVWSGTTLLEEIPLEGIKPGKNEISVLIPEPQDTILSRWILRSSLKTLKEKDLKWIPPRHWTIYVIKSTHMDLGLHKPMYIQRYESGQFFTQAKELSEETKDWPESSRYRYFMEGMNWWYSYAQDYSDSLANILIDRYVKSDLITIGASHSGNHTQSFGSEEMVRSTYYVQQFRNQWGINPTSMIMTDNNGISWPLVSVYANIGIKYLGFFPNTWNAPTVGGSRIRTENDSPYPHLFYWEGPDKTSRILVWAYNGYVGGGKDFGFRTLTARKPFIVEPEVIAPQMAVQLAKLEERYLYDIWLLADYDDNDYETPNLVFFNMVKAWNKKWKWPQLRAVGNLSEPFEIVEERFKNEIPTLSGTITGGWAQHPLTASDLLAQKRNIHRLLPTAEKLATIAKTMDNRYIYPTLEFKKAWNGLISYDEHSYGTSAYTGRTVYDTWSQKIDWLNDGLNIVETEGERALKSIANQISTDGTSIIVFNPSLQTRSEIIHFKLPEGMKNIRSVRYPDGSLSEIVRKGNSLSFLARNIPSLGYVVFRFVSGNLPPTENTIMEIPPIIENNFYKIKFDNTGSIVSVFDKELFHELVDQRAKYGFNQFVYTQDAHKSFSVPTVKHFEIEASSLGQTVVSYLEDTVSGASIKQSIFLPDFEKRIDIENRLNHVKDLVNIDRTNRYLRFGYYAFPIDIPRGKFKVELNGCVADAYKDQTGHGTNVYHAVNDWLHVSNNDVGITFVQNESHLIEFGKIHQNKTELEDYPMCSHIYSYIFTDWLYGNASTIGPSHLNFRFRYSITSHKGNVGDSYNARFAEKRVSPLQTAIIPDKQRGKSDKLFHSFASVTSDNIELLTLKMSEEPGRGIIVRFHETGGVKTKTTYRFDWLQDMQIIETSLSEQDLRELTNTNIELNPYGYTTIRLEAKGTGKLLSPNVSVKNITEKSIKLSWEKVDGAVQYNIYRATYDGFYHTSYHLLKTITDTLFVDDWIKSDKPYYYRISAIDKYFKEGDISLQLKVVTLKEGNFPPAKVGSFYTGLVSNPRAWRSDTSDVLYLQWGQNQDSDLSHYELFRGDRPDFVADENSFVTKVIPGPYVVVPYEDKGLKSHTYYYRVRAIDHDGNKGELSDVFEGITRELDN